MINFKLEIANMINNSIEQNIENIVDFIEIPKDINNGDYAFPCFKLAKELKKSPVIIAQEIKDKIKIDTEIIERMNVVGGYLNFYVSKKLLIKDVFKEFDLKKEKYGSSYNNGKNIIVEYSSPNIAKPFHIGHLRTTLIGNSLYKIYKFLGYNTAGINHLGDYGTQFGKIIEAYKMWGNEYNLEEDPINKMMDMYVRINDLCKKDEEVLEKCRENFRLLESGDKYCTDLWNKFKDLSMIEFNKIYKILNVDFDAFTGESFYADKTNEVVEKLEEDGKLVESEGAKIVDLEYAGIDTPCIIQKANGSSIYATRDLAAIMYRAREYDFDKCLYVVAYEQNLYFKQIFEVAKYLVDEKYSKGLEHISYGMVSLPTGKMSTRLGNVVKIDELINESIERVRKIIEEKNPELENKEEVAKKVGIGAIIFNTLSTSNIKDQIFDWNEALNFQGETGPYVQYTYVRTKSIIDKVEYIPKYNELKIEVLNNIDSIDIINLIYQFNDILKQAVEKNEPSIISRFLINLSKAYSTFYNNNKIIVDDKDIKDARIYLTYVVCNILKIGANLLGMEMPDRM